MNTNIDLLMTLMVILAIVVTPLVYIALRLIRLAEKKTDYDSDKYRLSIEDQIAGLSKQLTYSSERFERVNHLLLDSQKAASGRMTASSGPNVFLREMGVDTDISIDNDFVFVLTPFHPEFADSYIAIKEAVMSMGLRCSRGDDVHMSSNILQHILQEICRARLIVADITSRNPNVYYELGIAQALGKPVLLIARNTKDLPFDISTWRVLVYHSFTDLQQGLRKWLTQTLARRKE
ncbi:MAG: hypothetical protein K1Y02_25410 [Candidatus Hydrogenedentes bacterium]|nr:hypothetical protein [Candidatus Hydrogenedentota bacterium]